MEGRREGGMKEGGRDEGGRQGMERGRDGWMVGGRE